MDVTCRHCGKKVGEGQLDGMAFCNADCVFTHAMNIPLSTLESNPELRCRTTTVGDGVRLLITKKVGGPG